MLLENHQIRQSFWPCWHCTDLSPVNAGLLILQRCPPATAAPGSFIIVWLPPGEWRAEVSLPLCHERQAPSKQQGQSQYLYDGTGNKTGGTTNSFGHVLQCSAVHISPPWKVNRGRNREGPKPDTNPLKPTSKFHNEVLGPWHYTWQIHSWRSKGINQPQIISGHENMFSIIINLERLIFLTACLKEKWVIWLKEINLSPMPYCVTSNKKNPFRFSPTWMPAFPRGFHASSPFLCLWNHKQALGHWFLQDSRLRYRFLDSNIASTCLQSTGQKSTVYKPG